MKGSSLFAAAIALLMHSAQSHYVFQQLTINGDTEGKHQYVRPNTNLNFPIINQGSNDLRCNTGCHNGTNTTTAAVTAGSKVTWNADVKVYHQGPVSVYMTKVENATEADGSSKWFKIMDIGPSFSPKGGHWDATLQEDFEVQIPKCISDGEYLLRIEQIAIHVPGIPPQFHVACAQLRVTEGGKEIAPESHLVNIPEVFAKGHEGFTVNIYQNFRSYPMPGPKVWSC